MKERERERTGEKGQREPEAGAKLYSSASLTVFVKLCVLLLLSLFLLLFCCYFRRQQNSVSFSLSVKWQPEQ